MTTATITVSFVNPPKAGKKKGTIKTTDDQLYGVWPDKLALFQRGGTYTVDIEEREYQGQIYKTIKSIVSQSNGGATTKTQSPLAWKEPAQASGAPSFTKSEDMLLMGVIGRCYQGTGSLPDRLTLTMQMRNLLGAFHDAKAARQNPEPGSFEEEEME